MIKTPSDDLVFKKGDLVFLNRNSYFDYPYQQDQLGVVTKLQQSRPIGIWVHLQKDNIEALFDAFDLIKEDEDDDQEGKEKDRQRQERDIGRVS